MPSNQLSLICEQIEKQNTDHFGKFYMYISLLNTVSVRNKSFVDGLPQYSPGFSFWRGNHKLNIGEISTEFSQQVNLYSQQFAIPQPSVSNALYNIVMTYVRKGKITDLIYIIDKMLAHLTAIHGHQSHNQTIYEYIDFGAKKGQLAQFIKNISELNYQVLALVDNGFNAAFSILAAITGLVIILSTVLPTLIGLGLLVSGAYAAISYADRVQAQAASLETQYKQLSPQMERLMQEQDIFSNKNSHSFFSPIVTPLPYAVITGAEQIAHDEASLQTCSDLRSRMNNVMMQLNSI